MSPEPDIKDRRRQAHLVITTAKTLTQVRAQLTDPAFSDARYGIDRAIEALTQAVIVCPGIRLAVFCDEPEPKQEGTS